MRGPLSRSDPSTTERKLAGPGRPGTADGLVAKVERREVPRPTSLGARGHLAARGGDVNPASRGATSLHPGASRRSIPSPGSRGILQTSDALRRENAEVWLFESVDRNLKRGA